MTTDHYLFDAWRHLVRGAAPPPEPRTPAGRHLQGWTPEMQLTARAGHGSQKGCSGLSVRHVQVHGASAPQHCRGLLEVHVTFGRRCRQEPLQPPPPASPPTQGRLACHQLLPQVRVAGRNKSTCILQHGSASRPSPGHAARAARSAPQAGAAAPALIRGWHRPCSLGLRANRGRHWLRKLLVQGTGDPAADELRQAACAVAAAHSCPLSCWWGCCVRCCCVHCCCWGCCECHRRWQHCCCGVC